MDIMLKPITVVIEEVIKFMTETGIGIGTVNAMMKKK